MGKKLFFHIIFQIGLGFGKITITKFDAFSKVKIKVKQLCIKSVWQNDIVRSSID